MLHQIGTKPKLILSILEMEGNKNQVTNIETS